MQSINSVLYVMALWSVIGGFIYGYFIINRPDIPSGWCKVITLACGFLAWGMTVVWLLLEDLKNPEAWK